MTDKTVKFLMILNDMAWFWSHRLPLALAIKEAGWDLHVASHMGWHAKGMQEAGFNPHDLPPHGRAKDILKQIKLMVGIAKTILKTKPNIIHAVTIRYAFYAGLVTRLMFYKPVVFTVAGLGSLYTAPGLKMRIVRFFVLPIFRFAFGGNKKFVIFQNPDDRKIMVDSKIVKPKNSAVIRGSGVDLQAFPFSKYEEKTDEPIILFSSRLVREKGIDDFVAAARILKNKGVKARFMVAGKVYEDNVRSVSHDEMQSWHDEGVIEWVGHCDDMADLMRRSMMVVLPSYYGEGVPKVLLEAAAIGRPIVTCDAPGCREAVEHEVNGLLVLPKCPEDLVVAIEKLLNDPEKCHVYGAAGRQRVEKDFHVDHVVRQTMKVYKELLEEA